MKSMKHPYIHTTNAQCISSTCWAVLIADAHAVYAFKRKEIIYFN